MSFSQCGASRREPFPQASSGCAHPYPYPVEENIQDHQAACEGFVCIKLHGSTLEYEENTWSYDQITIRCRKPPRASITKNENALTQKNIMKNITRQMTDSQMHQRPQKQEQRQHQHQRSTNNITSSQPRQSRLAG